MSNNKQFNDTPSIPMVESSTSGEGKGSSGGQQSNEAGGGTEGEEQEEPSSSSSQISSVEDTLAHFREQWQKELVGNPQKKEAASSQSRVSCPIPATEEEQAANLFLKGIQHEQEGELYEAIQYYRRAVQLVPDIEFRIFENSKRKAKDELELETSEEEVEEDENNNDCHDEADEDDEDEDLLTRLQRMFNRAHCVCQPQFDQTATHMSALPMEIILFIFRWVVSSDLDLRSLEVCSRVCRGFYLCSRDPEIWRLACIKVWGVNCGILTKYNSWRQMFIERPRLHFNGCYISKTTYVRSGENSFQDRFYRPWHLVAYFRYLRFFPDGLVLMLTTPDDPISSLGLLRSRTPRNSAILSGHYMIRGNCTTLILRRQDNVKTAVNNRFRRRREFTQDLGEQTFHIELQIQSYKNKVNIQLIWEHYSVITKYRNGQESTSTFDLVSNKFPPFWFSRVKSYTTESENPLQ